MSKESLKNSSENKENLESGQLDAHELKKTAEKQHLSKEKLQEAQEKQKAEKHEARKSVEKSARKEKVAIKSEKEDHDMPKVTRGHKKQTYKATMNRVEAKLPAYQRAFSKVINNESVDTVSNITGKTIARPSALLGAGFFSFLGLGIFLFYAKRMGFELPPTLFPLLVVFGWALGIALEIIYKSLKKALLRR